MLTDSTSIYDKKNFLKKTGIKGMFHNTIIQLFAIYNYLLFKSYFLFNGKITKNVLSVRYKISIPNFPHE